MGDVFLSWVGSPKGLCIIFILTVFQIFNKSKAMAGDHEGSSEKKCKWPISTGQDVKVGGGERELETEIDKEIGRGRERPSRKKP